MVRLAVDRKDERAVRYIYIDLGVYDGDTIEQFLNWRALSYPEDIEWEIYGFDPTTRFHKQWKRLQGYHDFIKLERKAAWTEDTELEYSLQPTHNAMGSTIMSDKRWYSQGKIIKVQAFDLSEFLKQFEGEHVLVKMDIEGAELPVLTHLIKQGTDKIITKLFVEWHDGKMPTYHSNKDWIWENLKCEWHNWR